MRLAALLKSWSAGRDGGIPLMEWEQPVWGPVSGHVGDITDEMLRSYRSARLTIVQVWKDGNLSCIVDMLDAMKRRSVTLLGIDETFSLELLATEVAASTTCKHKLHTTILNFLPSLTEESERIPPSTLLWAAARS